jgi:hypothetical protein
MFRTTVLAASFAAIFSGAAFAAVSADEAKQLGTTLTAVGAEKAGNKDGTIPEYTGGIKAPADFKAGSGFRPIRSRARSLASSSPARTWRRMPTSSPKAPRSCSSAFPTMRVDVYPTHRTVAVPQRILDNTLKNATGAKTADGGVALENVVAGYPFPIPKTGSEAIWNHLLRYNGLGYDNFRYENWNVDAAGVPTLAVTADVNWAWPIFDPKKTGPINATDPYWLAKLQYVGPARRNGEALLLIDAGQPAEAAAPRLAVPAGQRRVGSRRISRTTRRIPAPPARARTTTFRSSTARSTATTGSSSARRRCTFRTAAIG